MPSPLTVLVVEDDNLLRELVRITIERRGRFRTVGEAEDATAGVALATELRPDVILLDLIMPLMSGFEALPRIRRAAPDATIIVLSMLQRRGVKEEVLARGADAFVDKGLDGEELEACLWDLCHRRPLNIADLHAANAETRIPSKTLNAAVR
jgi:DNA-binding NarL/FixJ family response regulator